MALIRATEWGDVNYWQVRISGYLDGRLSPQQALPQRACYLALEEDAVIGFIAGHLTRRLACDGEVQWINVAPDQRRKNVASELLRLLASWFISQSALRVCVDVDPSNVTARAFYRLHGAEAMKTNWLVWNDIRSVLISHEELN
jgi:ribosomal protein S18 acetylase RimI-like enzyme